MAKGRKLKRRSAGKPNAQAVFADMDLVIQGCRAALHSCDLESVQRLISLSKKRYANALRNAAPLAFTLQDVQDMDSKSVQLEELISLLEARCAALQGAHNKRV